MLACVSFNLAEDSFTSGLVCFFGSKVDPSGIGLHKRISIRVKNDLGEEEEERKKEKITANYLS